MLPNFRLVATGLGALAACAQALNMTNFTIDQVGCGTPSLSLEQWTHSEEILAQGKNTTKRQEAQRHRIPVHITVLAKNSTVNGGNIHDSQIQQVLDQVNKFYSYGFYLDTSVDTIHRYTRPDLFHPESGKFTGDFYDIQRQYHRGEGDYASLNIIFLFRLEDWYKVETITQQLPNGGTWTSTSSSSGGVMGRSSIPSAEIWKYSNALDLEKSDGMAISSAIIPDIAYTGYRGSLATFAHEFGHWVGLLHTDHSDLKDTWGNKVLCDPKNDGMKDTPTHMLDDNLKRTMRSCPKRGTVNTCQHLDSRSDPIYNLMISMRFGCEVDGLTNDQILRTLDVYREFRMPYKQKMQQQGRWVQPQGQQPQEKKTQEKEAQEKGPQEKEPQEKKPQEKKPQEKKPQEKKPQEKKPQEKKPQEKKPQEKKPQEKKPQEKKPQEKKPQEKKPQEKKPQEKETQDQQPQDKQGDWRQQEIARLQSKSDKAWDKFHREQANHRQQMKQTCQRSLDDCLDQVDQAYKRCGESISESMRKKYNQLEADRDGLRDWLERYRQQPQHRQWAEEEWNRQESDFAAWRQGYRQEERGRWQNLERDSRQNQQSCRRWAQAEEARGLRELEKWEKETVKILQDNDSRAQQYIDSL
ncbi:hypothetical protein MY1884_001946 [Beauveria asiatica]